MITGFNTDIEHGGKTYHVQTEDKGLGHPILLSLVYVGGEILASKRTPYDDLVAEGFDEKALAERLQRQHKLICAALRAGRIEDLKRMSERNGTAQQPAAHDKAGAKAAEPKAEARIETKAEAVTESKAEAAAETGAETVRARREKAPPPTPKPPAPSPSTPPPAPPAEAVPAREAEPAKSESLLDLITTDLNIPLTPNDFVWRGAEVAAPPSAEEESAAEAAEPFADAGADEPAETRVAAPAGDEDEDLYLSLLDDEGDFRAGQLATVKIHVGRGRFGRRSAPAANVTVKVLGTTFRPMILSTQTDGNGVAVVRALLPQFTSGRAAILIRATVAGGETAELRRIIHQA